MPPALCALPVRSLSMFYKLMLILVLFMIAIAALTQAFQHLPG